MEALTVGVDGGCEEDDTGNNPGFITVDTETVFGAMLHSSALSSLSSCCLGGFVVFFVFVICNRRCLFLIFLINVVNRINNNVLLLIVACMFFICVVGVLLITSSINHWIGDDASMISGSPFYPLLRSHRTIYFILFLSFLVAYSSINNRIIG